MTNGPGLKTVSYSIVTLVILIILAVGVISCVGT
jgi:hypothetical protein